jgi:hypothetical protein
MLELRHGLEHCEIGKRGDRLRLDKLLDGCGRTLGCLEHKAAMAREGRAYDTQRQQQPLHYENRPTV